MRILAIEDDKDVAAFIKKALRQEGYAVDTACDGISGEDLAFTQEHDLIILDILLPGKDGLSILKSLRANHINVPVLLLTALGDVSDRVCCLDTGADDYLVKPFSLAELRARVRSLLRRPGERSPVLNIGDLSMDTVAKQVRLNKKYIELTSREYAILEYLLRNKNKLVSKGMIAEHVWDFHFDSDYNLIEVYIRRLRNKIEIKDKIIRTVRNGGYIIREPEE